MQRSISARLTQTVCQQSANNYVLGLERTVITAEFLIKLTSEADLQKLRSGIAMAVHYWKSVLVNRKKFHCSCTVALRTALLLQC